MKKFAGRLVSVTLCFLLVCSVFAGCQKKESEQVSSSSAISEASTSNKAETKAAPEKIRIMNRVNAEVKIDNNPVLKEIENKLNIKLEYEAPPINNYVDKLMIVMAAGDIPDIVYNWGAADSNYEKWAESDILATLDDKIANYPNLQANISKEQWQAVRSVETGKIHSVPRANVNNYWGYMINQQWLDKLGLKAPTTIDEFTEVCRAFTNNDPDGNGKKDTYGVSFSGSTVGRNAMWNATDFITNAFGVPTPNGVKDIDGNYKIKEKFEGYIPYLTYLRTLNSEKLLDPEFFTNKQYADWDKQLQDRVGIVYAHQGNALSQAKKIEQNISKISFHAPLANKNGEVTAYIQTPLWGCWMISKNTKNIDACLNLLDFGNSKEGFILTQLGIKGTNYNDYNFDAKNVTRTEEQAKNVVSVTSTYMSFTNAINGSMAIVENGDTPERLDKYTKELTAAKNVMKIVNVPVIKAPKLLNFSTTNPDDVKKKDDAELKYILGEMTEQQFRDFLTNEYYPKVAEAEQEYIEFMNNLGK